MARKTFISYKYSESQDIRDRIVRAMGEDAQFYNGETADSPEVEKAERIKTVLTDMLFGTSVTIVVISPKMNLSQWIDWEIEYSLKEIKREDQTSRSNGIVGVVAKINNSYDWFFYESSCPHHNTLTDSMRRGYLPDVIAKNRLNKKNLQFLCNVCQTFEESSGSYISLFREEYFLSNIDECIENAYDKSQNIDNYNITKRANYAF